MTNTAERARILLGKAYQDLGTFHFPAANDAKKYAAAVTALIAGRQAVLIMRDLVESMDPDHDCDRCSDAYLAQEGAVEVGIGGHAG